MAETQQEILEPQYTEMTFSIPQVKAVDVLVRGIQVAQRRGAFNLHESASLNDAFKELIPGYLQTPVQTETETEEEVKAV